MNSDIDLDRFPPLGRRPEATTLTVRDLITRVREGRIRIPEFQRPLRWSAQDNRRLMDSLWRGYPIGSLLFWKRGAPAAQVKVAGTLLDAPAVVDALWIVDGQQRVMALAGSLLDLPHRGPQWVLHFDAASLAFEVGPPPADREDWAVPLEAMGDLRRLGRWIREHAPPEAIVGAIEDAQQRLLDYSVPVYVVDTDDERPLRAGFARLNSTGVRMRADEVFTALLGRPTEEAGLDLGYLVKQCQRLGFGAPPRVEIMKAILAMSGHDPSRRVESLPEQELGKLVSQDAAEAAIQSTVEFLRDDCGIPRLRLVPYPVVFFILAKWFHLYAATEPETRLLLARWVWRGIATGAHQRAAVSKMREQVRAIRADGPEAAVGRLLKRVAARHDADPWGLKRFHHDNARSRLEMLALLEAKPRDRTGPVELDALLDAPRFAREVFMPRDVPDELRELARTAANRVLLDTKATNLQTELKTWDGERDGELLASHFITPEAFEALRAPDHGRFLRLREAAICEAVDRLLASRTGWDEPEIRPARFYADTEEEE